MNYEELSASITTEEFHDVPDEITEILQDTPSGETFLQTCLECEVRAYWKDRSGPNHETLYLPPHEGYVKVRLGEIISFSLTAEEALSLALQLGHQVNPKTKRHILAMLEIAWTIDIGDVHITISNDTAEQLRRQLESCLP